MRRLVLLVSVVFLTGCSDAGTSSRSADNQQDAPAPDAPADGVKAVEEAFAALPSKIGAIKHFEWGLNNSPETHDDGFTHCFMLSFDSEEGRSEYLPHPDHLAFGKVLGPVRAVGRVLDFWAE